MTVIKPNSISGINSITAKTNDAVAFYESDGTSGNVIAGVVTATNLVSNVTGNLSGDIVGTRTLGTGVTVTTAGIVSATQYYGSGAKLTDIAGANITAGIPGANITGTIPQAALTNVDLSGIKKDIALLSLQNAVDTNRVAYNLSNSFVDQYENDVGIGASTQVQRETTGEYLATVVVSEATQWLGAAGDKGQPRFNGVNDHNTRDSSGVTYGWTNDAITINSASATAYAAVLLDYMFDLDKCKEVDVYIHWAVDPSGGTHNRTWPTSWIGIVPYTGTGIAVTGGDTDWGKSPTFQGGAKDLIRHAQLTPNAGEHGQYTNAHLSTYVFNGDMAAANWFNTANWNLSQNEGHAANQEQTIDVSGHTHGTNFNHYWNVGGGASGGTYGARFHYSKANNQIKLYYLSNSTNGNLGSITKTLTNVPSAGKFFIGMGEALGHTTDRNFSLANSNTPNQNGRSFIKYDSTTANATGNCISKANTASSARTKVSGVMLYKDASGTATLGTDLKVSFTCNGGTNWTALSSGSDYSAGSDFSTGVKTVYLAEKTCTSGTDIRYKIEWANQADGSKVTQVHGMALNY